MVPNGVRALRISILKVRYTRSRMVPVSTLKPLADFTLKLCTVSACDSAPIYSASLNTRSLCFSLLGA
jgi:hypothetical protein